MLVQRQCCPVCRSSNGKTFFSAQYADAPIRDYVIGYYGLGERNLVEQYDQLVQDGKYELKTCVDCRAIYQVCYPNEEFSQIIYCQWIEPPVAPPDDATGVSFQDAKHYIAEALKLTAMTMRLTRKTRPGQLRVLDFGMGRGGFASALKACGCETFGYDLAQDRQRRGAELGITVIGPGEVQDLVFDFINTEQVFEHLPDPFSMARTLADVLCPGGILKISVPFNRWLENGDLVIDWRAERYGRHSPVPNAPLEHIQYYRRPSLVRLGQSVGLKQVRVSATEHLLYSLEWLKPKASFKNIGRILAFERFRNYYLFQKPQ